MGWIRICLYGKIKGYKMNKKVIILVICVAYLLTITIITAMIIAGKRESKPIATPRASKQKLSQGSPRKEKASERMDASAALSEKEFEPPITGPLLQ
jgi:hypothetical protein